MKLIKLVLAGAALTTATIAVAHTFGIAYPNRGACESALARMNNYDRERLIEEAIFENGGDANKFFHATFDCEQDGSAWYIVVR